MPGHPKWKYSPFSGSQKPAIWWWCRKIMIWWCRKICQIMHDDIKSMYIFSTCMPNFRAFLPKMTNFSRFLLKCHHLAKRQMIFHWPSCFSVVYQNWPMWLGDNTQRWIIFHPHFWFLVWILQSVHKSCHVSQVVICWDTERIDNWAL